MVQIGDSQGVQNGVRGYAFGEAKSIECLVLLQQARPMNLSWGTIVCLLQVKKGHGPLLCEAQLNCLVLLQQARPYRPHWSSLKPIQVPFYITEAPRGHTTDMPCKPRSAPLPFTCNHCRPSCAHASPSSGTLYHNTTRYCTGCTSSARSPWSPPLHMSHTWLHSAITRDFTFFHTFIIRQIPIFLPRHSQTPPRGR